MTKEPLQPQDKYVLRMPDGMRDRIKAAAEKNNRSMNAEIIARLEASEQTDVSPSPDPGILALTRKLEVTVDLQREALKNQKAIINELKYDRYKPMDDAKELMYLRQAHALIGHIVRDAAQDADRGKLYRLASLLESTKVIEGEAINTDEMKRSALALIELLGKPDK
jgi:hypothetical protein